MPKYELLTSVRTSQSTCAAVTGRIFSVFYLMLQFLFYGMVYMTVAHQTIIIFSLTGWFFTVMLVTLNFLVGLIVCCAYFFDAATWATFKSSLTWLWAIQLATHFGVPLVFLAFRLVAAGDDDEQKAIYESWLLIFVPTLAVDLVALAGMLAPYSFLYQDESGMEVENVAQTYGRPQELVLAYYPSPRY